MTTDRSTRRARLAVGVLAALLVGGVATPADAGTPARVTLPSPIDFPVAGVPGPVADPGRVLHLRVYLAGRDPAGRVAEARAVSTPGSAEYSRYLTPGQYQERFGASDAQVARVGAWLRVQGMTVTSAGRHFLGVDGTVAAASAAFDAGLGQYPDGTVAPTTDVSVPAYLGTDVAAVTGLFVAGFGNPLAAAEAAAPGGRRTTPTPARKPTATAAGSTTGAQAGPADSPDPPPPTLPPIDCSHWWGQHSVPIPQAYGRSSAPTQLCGYTPTQLRAVYSASSGPYTGKGATVAVMLDGRSPTMEADADRFFAAHGLPGFTPGQFRDNVSPTLESTCAPYSDDGNLGDNPEESLDVETVHMIAPDANVVFVGIDCTYDGLSTIDAYYRVVDAHLADVTTDSWAGFEVGSSPATIAVWEAILQQGAVEGIGFDFASGDYGDTVYSDGLSPVGYPTSDPWATGVGGTSVQIGADGAVTGEYGWAQSSALIGASGYTPALPGTYEMGSGGGRSGAFARPAYQRGVVPDALATAGGTGPARRIVPDVSADAGAFWLIGYTEEAAGGGYGETYGGGTSGSSPILAALEADAKQATGHALGFVNPALYRLAGSRAVHDILPVDPRHPPMVVESNYYEQGPGLYLDVLGGVDGSLHTTPGYDAVTGIGSPGRGFVTAFR